MRLWFAVAALAVQLNAAVTIQDAVETLQRGSSLTIAGEPICATHPLPLFYARRNLQPAWSAADSAALVRAIRSATDDGLDPTDYHLAAIESATGAEADLLQTDAFFLLASHLLSGRVDPLTIEPTWCLEPRTSYVACAGSRSPDATSRATSCATRGPDEPAFIGRPSSIVCHGRICRYVARASLSP